MKLQPMLVFGASGLLGRTLAETLVDAGDEAVCLSHRDCDVTDGAAVDQALADHQPRLIVNAAAFTDVDGAESRRATASAVNADGPENIGRMAAVGDVPVIHVSTDCVFDGAGRRPYREEDPVAPISHYGRTKADGEMRLRQAQPRHVILRTAWLFGKSGGGFARSVVVSALQRQPIRAIVDQTGSPTAAIDLAGAILAVAAAIDRGFQSWGVFHYAGDKPATRLDVVDTVFDAVRDLGRPVPDVIHVALADFPAAAARPQYSALDSNRFVRMFGFPASDWKRRLAAMVEQEAVVSQPPKS